MMIDRESIDRAIRTRENALARELRGLAETLKRLAKAATQESERAVRHGFVSATFVESCYADVATIQQRAVTLRGELSLLRTL